MALKKFLGGWLENVEIAAAGVGEHEAERRMRGMYGPDWRAHATQGSFEFDRLTHGEPELALILLPVYVGRAICRATRKAYEIARKR